MKVKEIMKDLVARVFVWRSIGYVMEMMKDLNIGRVPIVDSNGKVIGIVTDRDIVTRGVGKGENYFNEQISTVMTSSVVSINSESNVSEALELMGKNKIRSLLIMDNGELVGIVTLGDILQTFTYSEQVIKALNEIYSK